MDEDPDGEGRDGITGVVDAGFLKFAVVMVSSSWRKEDSNANINTKMIKDQIGFHHQPFLSSFFFTSLCFSFVCGLGCNSGIEILLKWTVRFFGGAYLFFMSSSKLIRLGPFLPS